jgi:gamma-glutamyltranspeptidase/glutathione hydrolase
MIGRGTRFLYPTRRLEMPRQIIADTAAVAAGHPSGAQAGIEILREGGNAVDAAVGAMLALCVAIPGSVGLGGYGGSAVIRRASNEHVPSSKSRSIRSAHPVVAVDFDSRAPLAFRDGLVTADPESNYYGPRSVTIPAVVAGLDYVLREFGTMTWAEVSRRAIRLADDGVEFDSEHQRHLDRCAPKFDKRSLTALFGAGPLPKVGDCWRQPDLARLLRKLADDGPASFYEGDIARSIVRYLRERGGILSDDDFSSYQPQFVEPMRATCFGYDLFTPPPPSGGITSLAIVQTVERLLPNKRQRSATTASSWDAAYFHSLAETMKLCWRERWESLGDPDFVGYSLEQLVSPQAADLRAGQISQSVAAHSSLLAPQADSPHTANVIAGDHHGNLISITATQGWMYGSHLVVDGLGLVLNHGMSRFDYTPGHPNSPAAGKRMQHNMAPLIALRDGRPAFAVGLPGGPKIVSVTAQIVLDLLAFGARPAAAITAPRIHTDGTEPLLVSTHISDSLIAELEASGHKIRREEDLGGPVNVLANDPRSGRIDIASGEGTGAVASL